MNKLLPFLFIAALYAYITYANQLAALHNPVVSIALYIASVLGCAALIAHAKKEKTEHN